jgi:hypothetical protein
MGAGVMEDTYSDRLDIMACCKGDYSLHNRILSGWVPARERVTLSLADLAPGPAPAEGAAAVPLVRRYSLWPFDRPESKGQLKGVSLRLEDGKVLVLGFRWVGHAQQSVIMPVHRPVACTAHGMCSTHALLALGPHIAAVCCCAGRRSTPFWQDVRIKANASNPYSDERPLAPEHMRSNVQGLSVEYSKRYLDSPGALKAAQLVGRSLVADCAHLYFHPTCQPACRIRS